MKDLEDYSIEEDLEETMQCLKTAIYKLENIEKYIKKMINVSDGKYQQAMQDTLCYLNKLKDTKVVDSNEE